MRKDAGALTKRFVFGAGTDEPVVVYAGSGTGSGVRAFFHADERGSIVAQSNESGAKTGIFSYDEYGIPSSANNTRFQYTGQAWLPQIGMYYYKARMYSPTLGRFMQTDPIGYSDGMNIYAYVKNDPMNGADSSGMGNDFGGLETKIKSIIEVVGQREQGISFTGSIGAAIGHGGLGAQLAADGGDATERGPCPAVPNYPPDANLNANIREAAKHPVNLPPAYTPYGPTADPRELPNTIWFFQQVKYGGPWDYKTEDPKGSYNDFGNFNYGATGRAAGFTQDDLLNAAGLAQLYHDITNGVPIKSYKTRFDGPEDAAPIMAGVAYYDNKCY